MSVVIESEEWLGPAMVLKWRYYLYVSLSVLAAPLEMMRSGRAAARLCNTYII